MINPFLPAALLSLAAVTAFTMLAPEGQGERPIRLRPGTEKVAPQPGAGAAAEATLTATLNGMFQFTIEGTRQGLFKGEGVADRQKDKLIGLRWAHEIKSPRDVATGQASGKRQHGPIIVTKEVGGASPQIFTALTTNEVLKTVQFEFVKPTATGEMAVSYTVKLTNATVSNLRQHSEDGKLLEDVSFTYQKIEVTCPPARSMAQDDWNAGN